MEDDLSGIYGGMMAQQEAPQTMPVPDVEFTEADGQQLRGLQNGLARLDQKAYSGEIDPEKAAEIKQQVAPRLGQLKQKQQVAQQQQDTQLEQAAMQQSAAQESINQVHLKARAEGFPQTVATLVHEMSGHIAHFFQDKMGSWSQVDWSKSAPEQPESGAPENYFPGAQTEQPAAPVGAADAQAADDYYPFAGGPGAAVGQPRDWEADQKTVDEYNAADGPMKRYLARFGYVQDALAAAKARGYPGNTQSYQRDASGRIDYTKPPVATPTAQPPEQSAPTPPNSGPQQETPTAEPAAPPVPMRHVMTIQNGQHVQKFAFNPEGTIEKVDDNHPDWTEIGHSGVQTGEVEIAFGKAAHALAAMGFHPPRVITSGPPAVVAQSMRMQDAYMNRVSSVAQNIVKQQSNNEGRGETQKNMLARIKASNDAKDARQDKQIAARESFHQNYLNHQKVLTTKDVNGNPVLPSAAAILTNMRNEQQAYQTLHGQTPQQPSGQAVGAPQGMPASAQDFINSQLK